MTKERQRPDVALFLPLLMGGGAERVTLNLARGLRDRDLAVDLVVAVPGGSFAEDVPDGVTLVPLGARRSMTSLIALVRYLRRRSPTAFLSALNHANIVAIGAARLANYRGSLWVAEHNDPRAGGTLTLKRRGFHLLMRWFYPRADGVIAVSHGVREGLIRQVGVPGGMIQVIYNPVITPETCAAFAERPGHPFFEEGPVVVAIGRLTKQKNFANLLRAFARLRDRSQARLIVLGEGEERASLEQQIDALGLGRVVSMPGFVANPYAYLGAADLFVLSSDWEGLPTVLIEALAAGTPVVATDCRSGPREILGDGAYGALVPVGDSDALADAMALALEAREERPRHPSLGAFTLESAAEAYARVLGIEGAPKASVAVTDLDATDSSGSEARP